MLFLKSQVKYLLKIMLKNIENQQINMEDVLLIDEKRQY